MTKQIEIVADIIRELKWIQGLPKPPVDKDDILPIPRMIATGNGNGIIVSKKIDQLIADFAHTLHSNDASLATRFTSAERNEAVRNAFGAALLLIGLADDTAANARKVTSGVKSIVAHQAGSQGRRDYCFGCTLFRNTDIADFQIAPVRFEPRLDWLTRKADEGAISAVTRRRVASAWQGRKPAKRKRGYDAVRENNILDTIGGSPYVCTVATDGFGTEAGREKALTAARLALTAIALLWEPSSKALDGFNLSFDRAMHRQKSLIFAPGKIFLSGSKLSHMPHGPYLKPGSWEKQMAANQRHFAVASEILEYFLKPDGKVARPKTMNSLGQALLWFHEACREPVALMAIVKFSASMDALASGKKSSGILKVLCARLGIADSTAIRPSGPTVKQVIEEIYSDGRSRTIHGTNERLGYDWSDTRALAEYFARYCLMSCMDWAGTQSATDDPLQLMK
jgi:hypothetical protein